MDIANPYRTDGALDYVPDIWGKLGEILADASLAGTLAFVVGLVIWAIVAKVMPDYKPRLGVKLIVMGFVAPTLVIVAAYVARIIGHYDYFTAERFAAVLLVWWKVTLGTGFWAGVANYFGLSLDTLLELIRQVLGEREAEKEAAQQ